jgi:hypothetical protein
MAVTVVLSEIQRAALQALCDTVVPALDAADDPCGFYARAASDLRIADLVEQTLGATVPEEGLAGLRGLLDALAAQGMDAGTPQAAREQILHGFMDA